MAAFLISPVRLACALAVLSATAAAQPPQATARPEPGIKSNGDAATVPRQTVPDTDVLAAALRASTRDDPANHVPSVVLLKEFLEGPHTGPAADAVVGVEIINQAKGGATEARHCSGLLLRCDGFFLLPPSITSLSMAGGEEAARQSVRVTLYPGTPRARKAIAYIRHYIVDGIDMTVMKLQDVHARAARPLMPVSLKPGDDVELAWTDWDAGAGRFTAIQTRKTRVGVQPAAEADLKILAWNAGEIKLEQPAEGVPAGAAVVGPEGFAVGLLPGSVKRHDRFVSFALLDRITNCVVAAPTTDEEFARLQKADSRDGNPTAEQNAAAAPSAVAPGGKPAHAVNDMVAIPAGPVRLPAMLLGDQRDMCAEAIACVPAFKIDRYKVSNREYYDFWMSLPMRERSRREVRALLYPVSWADADPPFPAEIDDVPVLGVTVAGARAYAQSKGKRLPTTYEWSRAVFGLFGDAVLPAWIADYMRDRQKAWARIVSEHDQYVANMIPDLRRRLEAQQLDQAAAKIDRRPAAGPPNPSRHLPTTIPFLDPREEFTEACRWSQGLIHEEVTRLCEKWISPLYVLPAGSRPFDASPFGVMDVILNGNERAMYSPEPRPGVDPLVGGRPTTIALSLSAAMRVTKLTQLSLWPILPMNAIDNGPDGPRSSPLLLSRRLVSSSSRVRPELREFTPADSEAFVEYRSRIHEEMTMAAPVDLARVVMVRSDLQENDQWGEGTVMSDFSRETRPNTVGRYGQALSAALGIGPFFTAHVYHTVEHDGDSRITLPEHYAWEKRYPLGAAIEVLHPAREITYRQGTPIINSAVPFNMPERFQLGGAPGAMVRWDEAAVVFLGEYFDETWFYPVWSGVSPFLHREMGRDWARDPLVHVGAWPKIGASLTQPPDIYLIPNGFRCAR